MSAKNTGLVLLLALVGCGGEDEASLDRVTEALEVGNGVRLNGVRLNGVRLNGVRLNGVRLNGVALSGVSLVSGALQGINSKGVLLSGTTLIGSELTGDADVGPITIRVDGAVQVGKGGTGLWYYQLSASVDGTWSPVCELDANGNAYGALLTRGVWNQDQGVPGGGAWTDDGRITIACANSAIAKCLDAGYRPWALGEESNPMHLQACVRMIRADYCGNGAPWTVDGRALDVWDDLRILKQAEPKWTFEAAWSADGAACLQAVRVIWIGEWPLCAAARLGKREDCPFGGGIVLMDSFEQRTVQLSSAR